MPTPAPAAMNACLPAPAVEAGARDYDTVRRAIAFLSTHWTDHPDLGELADHLGLSPPHA